MCVPTRYKACQERAEVCGTAFIDRAMSLCGCHAAPTLSHCSDHSAPTTLFGDAAITQDAEVGQQLSGMPTWLLGRSCTVCHTELEPRTDRPD